MNVLIVMVSIVIAFPILFAIKELSRKYFCVICASVSVTWFLLVVLFRLGYFTDPVIVALLMGESVLGIYYLVEKRVPDMFLLFRLPFLLTLTALMYLLLMGIFDGVLYVVLLLGLLWGGTFVIYSWQSNAYARTVIKKMIACCRGW